MSHVFLSYRREDTATDARRLHDRLVEKFGDEGVFLDVEDIPLGVDFVDAITEALERAAYVLVAIGPRWLLVTDDENQPRLRDPGDLVRYEIKTALRGERMVVPVLIGGADMPKTGDLPEDIAPLVRHNGIAIRPDPDFDADVDDLMQGLDEDRIHISQVPVVFRVGLVARGIALGGAVGWGALGALLGLFAEGGQLLVAGPLAGVLAGSLGGAGVGWSTGMLIRHKSPPLVARQVFGTGLIWSFGLAVSAVVSGVVGFFLAEGAFDDMSAGVETFGELLGAIFVGFIVFLLVLALVLLVGLVVGSALMAAFVAARFRMRSEEITRLRATAIAAIWLVGGLLTWTLFFVLVGVVAP